jgi:membrane protein DedA with SNARE-associated domain/rhodanese-related sulfurtransferase
VVRTLLLQHGYWFLFLYILAVQAGVPIPADPLLLIMGALAGDRLYTITGALAVVLAASLIVDYCWYELGRRGGRSVLALICKLALEPDTCVRKTESTFSQRGAWALLFTKFVPGMGLVAMPLSGLIRMPRWRFLLADAGGTLLWSGAYLLAGFLFHRQVSAVIEALGLLGRRAGIVALALIGLYLAFKYVQRRRLLRQLRIDRITPEELRRSLDAGESLTVIDLRHPAEVEREGLKLAGAVVIRPDDLRSGAQSIPRDREIILYCTCPNEATSARLALQLKKAGIRKVRPLAGGLEAWREKGYPVEPVPAPSSGDDGEANLSVDAAPEA